MGATLRNETEDEAEASFAYPLPKGAVINGYALDIDGALVDGVLMPKERAEKLYTDRRRSIRLDFAAPVPAEGLRLPLVSTRPIEQVTINISGDGAELAKLPIDETAAKDVILQGEIFIPAAPAEAVLSQHKGQTVLTVPLSAAPQSEDTALSPQAVNSIAVIWDSSLSRSESDLAAERNFVASVLSNISPQRQSLIYGADRADFAARYDTPAQLGAALARITYDGATDLSALLDIKALERPDIQADICLVVTDGKSSIGEGALPSLPCRVFTFNSAKNPNTDWLSLLASRNDGADLSGLSVSDAARLRRNPKFWKSALVHRARG